MALFSFSTDRRVRSDRGLNSTQTSITSMLIEETMVRVALSGIGWNRAAKKYKVEKWRRLLKNTPVIAARFDAC